MTLSRFAAASVTTSMDRQVELQLVDLLRTGDPEAFNAVHNAFNARLYSFLVRLSNRRDVAEDLLEETWLRLVVHAPRLSPDTRLAPWLFTVARHLFASYCRARLVENSHAQGLIGLWPCASAPPSPLVAAESNEAARRMATALASLPSTYREALLLVAVEGLQPWEAAEVCGVTPQAMRQRLSRARAQLARRLTADGGSGLVSLKEVPT